VTDVAGLESAVQSQIRSAFTRLQQKTSIVGTPAVEFAESYGEMGKLYLATEMLEAADGCFRNAEGLQPADVRWLYYRAHIERRRNDPARAAALFQRTLTIDPNYVPSLMWLAEMRLVEGQPEAAVAPITRAVALRPNDAGVRFRAGRVALANRDYTTAVSHFTEALRMQPEASSVRYPLSLAYRGLGDAHSADAQLKLRGTVDAVAVDPLMQQVAMLLKNTSAAEVRGSSAMANRQWPEAIRSLREAIALSPDNAYTHLNLGTALFETGDPKAALDEFQTATRLAPGLSKAHYGAGVVFESAGRDREAIEAFTKAVESDPGSVEAHMSLADALRRNGRERESLPHYADVIARNPAVSQATFGYAMALVRLGRYREARERLDAAAKTYADQPGFAHALARLLAAAPDDSVRDGARALTIAQGLLQNQRTLELMQTMAMALAEVGRFEEAAQWQRDAMAAAAQSNRRDLEGRLAENLGRYEKRLPCRVPWPENDPVFRPRPSK
jgi:tetratricopeptide (TPR) repeat protein